MALLYKENTTSKTLESEPPFQELFRLTLEKPLSEVLKATAAGGSVHELWR